MLGLNIVDAIIILFLLAGAALGFKRGFIPTAVSLIGTILVVILAFILKNPLSTIMYTHLPFFNFGGAFEGVEVVNILFYEAVAFLIVFSLLMFGLRILLVGTGLVEKILKLTIVLSIPSKILGALLGLVHGFIILFILLFIFAQFSFSAEVTRDSKYTYPILNRTPILSRAVGGVFNAVEEIYSLRVNHASSENYNLEALEILLRHDVISVRNARVLIERGKITTPGADYVVDRHEENTR